MNITSSLHAVVTSDWSNNLPINTLRRVICGSSVNASYGIPETFWSSLFELHSNLDVTELGRFCNNVSCKEQFLCCGKGHKGQDWIQVTQDKIT
jgi:hypothetical protein